ncbi:hypothetical protein V1478_005716 [Vespula squamosa]|uniref:Uncharacterized protein n=1 Tax=Vespula squamosa TaxID=30214 RepID=A0ABD2B9M2_VESSQ
MEQKGDDKALLPIEDLTNGPYFFGKYQHDTRTDLNNDLSISNNRIENIDFSECALDDQGLIIGPSNHE